MRLFCLVIGFCFLSVSLWAQINIQYPYMRQVFQRDNENKALVSIIGNCDTLADKVEAKIEVLHKGQGIEMPWQLLDASPKGGFFQGNLQVSGGWYRLKIRYFKAGILADSTQLDRFGVGEVFVIMGQSNAQGGADRLPQNSKALDDRVITANFSNVFQNASETQSDFPFVNNLDFPESPYQQFGSNRIIGPKGFSNYHWPILGDSLVNDLNVPVCFFNVAWSGTSVKNWYESSLGLYTQFPYVDFPFFEVGFPYANFKGLVNTYLLKNGFRAILWHQGETDTEFGTSENTYQFYLKGLIDNTTSLLGRPIPWLISKASYRAKLKSDGTCDVPMASSIALAQEKVYNESNTDHIFSGPDTDVIEIPRKNDAFAACVHFTQAAYPSLAQSWKEKVMNMIQSKPGFISPFAFPKLVKACDKENQEIVKVQSDFQKVWIKQSNQETEIVNGQTSLNRSDFQIAASYKSFKTFFPLLTFKGYEKPIKPVIQIIGDTVFCEGQTVKLRSTASASYRWSTASNQREISVTNSGRFQVQNLTDLGCASVSSEVVALRMNPRPAPASIQAIKDSVACQGTPVVLQAKASHLAYQWSNGSKESNLSVNTPGAYHLVIRDKNNCESLPSNSVQVSFLANPTKPNLERISPYTLYGGIKPLDVDYRWYINNSLSNQTGVYLKLSNDSNVELEYKKNYPFGRFCLSPKSSLNLTLPKDAGLSLYPNPGPAYQEVQFESKENFNGGQYFLYDLSGKELLRGMVNTDLATRLKLQGIGPGTYVLILQKGTETLNKRLLVQ